MTIKKTEGVLLLGIDLGTARTAVMSNRQFRALVHTVVGFPKDIIGVKILNRTQVIGVEAIEKRAILDLYHPLQDGVLKEASEKDLDAAHEILQHVVELAQPKTGERICGIIGVPARASGSDKSQLLKIAKEFMDVAMVVSEPFMVAYGQNRLNNAIILDVGAGTIDICAMRGTVPGPESQMSILKGGNYIDALLETAIRDANPGVQVDRYLAQGIKERHGFVGETQQRVMVPLRIQGKPADVDVTEPLRITCETIVADMVEGIKRMLLQFDPESQSQALANLLLAGGGSRIRGLGPMIESQLRDYGQIRVTLADDPDFAGAEGALKLATELPTEYWDQIGEVIGA
ncbi:Magnetosome protein MamK [Candidatus Magnetaquicoccaceae bacterium FCR-1]|uniref:Magnetosome protein MamK n=1 Tax=Candidatus Magnetaquiglobus chichijimensis TaxID=3141448 RepID=A0ABQ0C841_9PROT